jgi:hypothetical protein
MDQEGEEMAIGAFNLADLILQQDGDLIKAEELARESLRITTLTHDSNDYIVDLSCDLLARILSAQGKLGDETSGLYERSLALSIRNERPDGNSTAIGNYSTGEFHNKLAKKQLTVDTKRTHLLLAKPYFI